MKTINKVILFCIVLLSKNLYSQTIPWVNANDAQNEYNNKSIDYSKKVIKLEGNSSVSSSGNYMYNFNIDVPAGVNKMNPMLSLNYISGTGENQLGLGWKLSGLSSISRSTKNYYYDGKSSKIEFNSNDPFTLNGQRLQPKNGNNGLNGETYELETETYNEIKSIGAYKGNTGVPDYFEVKQSDGKILTFGRYNNAVVENRHGNSVLTWYLSRIEDKYGNYIDYNYGKLATFNEVVITSIKYGGNLKASQTHFYEVKFNYLNKNTTYTPSNSFVSNSPYLKEKVLDNIEIYINNSKEKTYKFEYFVDKINTYLYKINLINSIGEDLNPIIFEYDYLKDTKTTITSNDVIADKDKSMVLYHDFDGDAINDMIEITYENVRYQNSYSDLYKIMIGEGYPSETYLNASKIKFYKNNYSGNKSTNTNFSLTKQYSLNTNLAYDYKVFLNQNFRYGSLDLNSDGTNELVLHEVYLDNTYTDCELNPPSKIGGYIQDMYVYINSHYYEYDKTTNDITAKVLPKPNLPSLSQLGIPNSIYQPYIINASTDPFWNHRYFPSTFFTGDFNGDGFIDYLNCLQVAVDDHSNNEGEGCHDIIDLVSTLYISFPKQNNFNQLLDISKSGNTEFRDFCMGSNMIEVIEYNGNGKSDIFVRKGNTVKIFEWNETTNDFDVIYNTTGGTVPFLTYEKTAFGDFNGDGLTDVLGYNSSNMNSSTASIYYSDGVDYVFGNTITIPVDKHIDINSENRILIYTKPIIADFNGDGISDITLATDSIFKEKVSENYVHGVPQNVYFKAKFFSYFLKLYYKKANEFKEGYEFYISKKDKPWIHSATDINGDNKADFSHQYENNQLKFLSSNFENSSRNMTGIQNSFGEYENVIYKRLNDKYTPIYTFNNIANSDPLLTYYKALQMEVVSKTKKQNYGFNDDEVLYEYSDLLGHRQGKGLLGFRENRSIHNGGELFTTNKYKASLASNYNMLLDKSIVDDGFTKATTTTDYLLNKRPGSNKVIQILPYIITKVNERPGQKTIEEAKYTYTGFYDNIDNIETKNSYVDNISNTIVNIKSTKVSFSNYVSNGSTYPDKAKNIESETKDLVQNLTHLKSSEFTYNALGDLSSEKINKGEPCELTTSYIYNIYGNRVEVSQSALGQSPRVNKIFYDLKGLNIVKSINAQNQIESEVTYNSKYYAITKKDIRGIISEIEYDNWGGIKKLKEKNKNIYTNFSVNWGGSNTRGGYYHSKTIDQNGAEKTSYYQIDGRLLEEVSEGRNGNKVYSYIGYDYKKRKIIESKPFILGETPIENSFSYNSVNQLESYTTEQGQFNVSYSFLKNKSKVTTTDPSGKTKTTVKDVLGRTIEDIDNLNNSVTHTYNPADQILETRVNGVVNIKNIYNSCGLLESQDDISNGKSTYVYDAWGQITQNTNARGQIEGYEYDIYGKKTKTSNPEGDVYYHYKQSGNGINEIDMINIKGKDTKEDVLEIMTYDAKSRLASYKKQIGGVTLRKSFQYNDRNQITKQSFNSGVSLDYSYDTKGFLQDIKDNYGKIIYTINSANGQGSPTNYTLGNGITTVNTFSGSYPQSSSSINSINGQVILDYNVNIDPPTGNVLNREFKRSVWSGSPLVLIGWGGFIMQNFTESFNYDGLDRLSEIISNGASQTINYDDIGNINNKYDVGDYTNNSKNQVRAVTNDYGEISTEMQVISYTSFEQPLAIREGFQNLKYSYAPDQQRIRAQWRTKPVPALQNPMVDYSNFYNLDLQRLRYYFGDYELNAEVNGSTNTVNAEYIHYIRGIDGKIVSLIRKPTSLNPSTAINTSVVLPTEDELVSSSDDFEPAFNPNIPALPLSEYYFVYTDHLGSLLTFTDVNANVIHEQNFDAWGRARDVNTMTPAFAMSPYSFIYRGYTEHEQIEEFKLINMNGRIYDPILGRFLSTDASVNDPSNSQSYNRYTYCLNNPLKYTDPSGENINPISTFLEGVSLYLIQNGLEGNRVSVFGAVQAGGVYTVNAYAANAIGDLTAFGLKETFLSGGLKFASNIALHGLYQGMMAEAQGGDFLSGFTTASISSVMGGLFRFAIDKTGIPKEFTDKITGKKTSNPVYLGIGLLSGAVQGFLVDKYINKGNGWDGAIIGSVVVGFNHFMPHSELIVGGEEKKEETLSEKSIKLIEEFKAKLAEISDQVGFGISVAEVSFKNSSGKGAQFAKKFLPNLNYAITLNSMNYDYKNYKYGSISKQYYYFKTTANVVNTVAGTFGFGYGVASQLGFFGVEFFHNNFNKPLVNYSVQINNNNLYWLYGR